MYQWIFEDKRFIENTNCDYVHSVHISRRLKHILVSHFHSPPIMSLSETHVSQNLKCASPSCSDNPKFIHLRIVRRNLFSMIRNTEIYSTKNFILSKAKNSSCGPSIDNTMTMFMLLKSPKDECEISTWRATQLQSKCNTFTHDFHMLLVVTF